MALVIIVSAGSAVLALALGWLIERTDLPFRRLWSIVTVLPLVIPSYIMAFLFISVFAPRGMVQRIFAEPFGIQEIPSFYGLPGAAIVLILVSYPYTLLTVRAALRGSGRALEEASRTLGKGPWETFMRVTLPQMRPALASGSLLVALYTISDFGAVSLMRYETFTWAIYLQYTSYVDRTAAAALSLVLVGLAIVLFLTETTAHGDRPLEETHQAEMGGADSPSVPLGPWKYPALGLCSLVGVFALLVPMAVLLFWLVRGIGAGEELSAVWGPAINSALVSSLAAVAGVFRSPARRGSRRAIPRPFQCAHRPRQPRRIRVARHRHRPRARLFRFEARPCALPDTRHAGDRVRDPLPTNCDGAGADVTAAGQSSLGGSGTNARPSPSHRFPYNYSAVVAPRHPGRRRARIPHSDEGASCNLALEPA